MSVGRFLIRQIAQLRRGGFPVLTSKLRETRRRCVEAILMVPAVAVVLVLRAIRPWVLVRFHSLNDMYIGHLAGNTELYLCERDAGINVPSQRYVDLVHASGRPVCNQHLFRMWKRSIRIWPGWLMQPVFEATHYVPGGAIHRSESIHMDHDVHNLLDRYPPHLRFTAEEEAWGQAQLRAMGLPANARFVCLIVRDSTYEDSRRYQPAATPSVTGFRNCDVQNFVLAAEELARRGYWVIRMGAKVREPIRSRHPMVIDYATNGMRTEFMDVYLGATCTFCLSTNLGFDTIPTIFRRPIALVNQAPLGGITTFHKQCVGVAKRYYSLREKREMTLREIAASDVAVAFEEQMYEDAGVRLVENTAEEIRDLAVEMSERLHGTWRPEPEDDELQARFWALFPGNAPYINGWRLHGAIRGRFGAAFLRNNREWLR